MTQGERRRRIGAVEGGGTKFVCVVADVSDGGAVTLLDRAVVPTAGPSATLGGCLEFFAACSARLGRLDALGIACFGPLQLRADAADFGHLLPTPKPGWSGVDVRGAFARSLAIPVTIETDVAAAALGEWKTGAGAGLGSLAYVTVGTGIGGAVVPSTGARLMHSEMGHLVVRRDARDGDFAGTCPFHGDCLEGMASGPAVQARWGSELAALPPGHPGRAIIAGYVAQLATAIVLLQSPECIVIGGGVAQGGNLLPEIRRATHGNLRQYLPPLQTAEQVAGLIRPPGLGGDSAIVGALLMALEALSRGHA